MKRDDFDIFAITSPGLEEVCAAELKALGLAGAASEPGGASFRGGLREIYLANLRLRSASRVVVRLGEFRCRDFPDLYRKAVRLPWGRFLRPDARVQVRAASRASRLTHTGRIAETVTAAADRALGRSAPPADGPEQLVLVRFFDDRCTVSVDSSGGLLHRRGYREEISRAPLRETLAAGILLLLGWDGSSPLLDPMCGSGTFLIEAALLAGNRAPGGKRSFAFMDWPRWRPGLWQALLAEAGREEREIGVHIGGSDRDSGVATVARRNAARAGVAEAVEIRCLELAQAAPPAGAGLLLCNPPYGERLGEREEVEELFRTLGEVSRSAFRGWRLAFLAPDDRLARATGLELTRVASLDNGGIRVSLFATGG